MLPRGPRVPRMGPRGGKISRERMAGQKKKMDPSWNRRSQPWFDARQVARSNSGMLIVYFLRVK